MATVHFSQTVSRRWPHHTQSSQHCASRHTEENRADWLWWPACCRQRAASLSSASRPPAISASIHALPFLPWRGCAGCCSFLQFPFLAWQAFWELFLLQFHADAVRWKSQWAQPIPDSISSLPLIVFPLKLQHYRYNTVYKPYAWEKWLAVFSHLVFQRSSHVRVQLIKELVYSLYYSLLRDDSWWSLVH